MLPKWTLGIILTISRVITYGNSQIFPTAGNSSERRDLPFPELAKYDGYKTETHHVVTSDGYILTLFRLPLKKGCEKDPNKDPMVFMHGLYLSSADCLVPGPRKAHCYIYADNCYDVWAPNSRGNVYSRNHTTLNPDKDSKFWNFTFDEMALYDMPAILDYILETTGHSQVSYVGHSQGTTVLLILCAKRPEYNAKIKVAFGISPTAWLDNARFFVLYIEQILSLFPGNLNIELLPADGGVQQLGKIFCGTTALSYPACSLLYFAALGYDKFQITDDILPVVTGHFPAGTSYKTFVRYGQIKRNGFSEYDHGLAKNLAVYGQAKPPIIDLSQVTMKWIFIASENDYLGDVRDINILLPHLSDARMCVLSDKTFGHLDFIYGKDIPNYVTPTVLNYLEKGEYTCA